MTRSPYILQLDDDVIDAPPDWDARLLSAFRRMPRMGWLAADVEDDRSDRVSFDRHHKDTYIEETVAGTALLVGPTGGWCTLTSRAIYDEIGGLPDEHRFVYFCTDAVYVKKIEKAGYRYGILPELRVRHSGDRAGAQPPPLKAEFHDHQALIARRKDTIKRVLLVVPGIRAANKRYGWFHEPAAPDGPPMSG
jgi:GT2 family glycosyltransferase